MLAVNWFTGYDIGFCPSVSDGRTAVSDKDGVFSSTIPTSPTSNSRTCKSLKDEI